MELCVWRKVWHQIFFFLLCISVLATVLWKTEHPPACTLSSTFGQHYWGTVAVKHKSRTACEYFQSWPAQIELVDLLIASVRQRWYWYFRETWRLTQQCKVLQDFTKQCWLATYLTGYKYLESHIMLILIVNYCFCDVWPGKEYVRTLHLHKALVWSFWKQLWEALSTQEQLQLRHWVRLPVCIHVSTLRWVS